MTTFGDRIKARNAAVAGMNSKVCGWPLCECKETHDRLYHEAVAMADESQPLPTEAELDALYVAATINLAGISKCCADRRDRYLATIMMLNPAFREANFDAALARLCDSYEPPADPEPEPRTYVDPDDVPRPVSGFLGTAGKETLLQRQARHAAINRKRRMTLYEVPAAEAPPELEPKAAVNGGSN
jgi:hypothetical protein